MVKREHSQTLVMNSRDSNETVGKEWGGGGAAYGLDSWHWNAIVCQAVWYRSIVRISWGLGKGDEVRRIVPSWNLGQGRGSVAVVVAVRPAAQPTEANLDVDAIWATTSMPKEAGQPDDGRMVAVAT